jgi:hypothetical protein
MISSLAGERVKVRIPFKDLGENATTTKYSYVRFRWWDPVDLHKAVGEFPGFKTKKIVMEKGGMDISIYRDLRDEVEVEADTLQALLSPFRVVINQKETKPFTARDMELREKLLKMYPRGRPTPFPWEFSTEPAFEKE